MGKKVEKLYNKIWKNMFNREVIAMIRAAICDDEKQTVKAHEKLVKKSLQACGIGFEITIYMQSSDLLCDIKDDGFL